MTTFPGPIEGIFVTKTGDIYVSDADNHVIRKISASNPKVMTTVAGTVGVAGYSGDGEQATKAKLNVPRGIFVDEEHNTLYFADSENNRIRMVNKDGVISTIAGTGKQDTVINGELALNTPLSTPRRLTVHKKSGEVYFLDFDNFIYKIGSDGRVVRVAGTGSIWGEPVEGEPAIRCSISPSYVALNKDGQVLFDSGEQIFRIDREC